MYDRYGNRLSQTLNGGTLAVTNSIFSFNTKNQPTGGFSFDLSGNTLDDGVTHNYIYDAENRYVKLGTTQVNTYDGTGLRMEKVTSGSTAVYVFSGMQVIAEYSPSAVPTAPTKEYIYLNSQLLTTLDSGGNPTYRHPDNLSGRLYADGSGNVTGTQGHLPFGESWYSTGTVDKWKFTSYERDSDTGLDYALMRFDSARLARFMTPDAYMGSIDGSDPQSWNRYTYVGNDPCNATDPLGQDTCTFNIKINNKAGLTDSQLAMLEAQINAVLGSAQDGQNSVQAQFSSTGQSDFQLNVSPKSFGTIAGWSGWPFWSPTIYWGSMANLPSATLYGGTAAAHEIVHRGAGPVFDSPWGSYNGTRNLMNANQAGHAGLGPQVFDDWTNPDAATGFASLSSSQVAKLYKKCKKKHQGGTPTDPTITNPQAAPQFPFVGEVCYGVPLDGGWSGGCDPHIFYPY